MIPYFTIPSIHLFGPVSLHFYGVLMVLGIVLAYRVILKGARDAGITRQEMQGALICAFVVGTVGAHVIEVLLYQPELVRQRGPFVFFQVFTGLSSIGAFFGGLLGLYLYFKRRHQPWILHFSIIAEGFVVLWAFVRLGCTLAHDHLGAKTSFLLAFNYPSGPRHNLGFYEFLMVILVLFPLTMIHRRRQTQPNDYVGSILLAYGSLRFGLDFLRATDLPGSDPRYWGLTAAQYGCVALACAGVWILLSRSFVPLKNARRAKLDQLTAPAGMPGH
jgi:phosphatidylglycerol:prolipoprotein diacylglycerol transferase